MPSPPPTPSADEHDEYDEEFERRREAAAQSRRVAVQDELQQALRDVDSYRERLKHAKEQVRRARRAARV